MEMWAIWLIVAGILLVLEMMTMTFYLLWLCIGSLVAVVVALVAPEAYFWQVALGCLVAVVLTVFTKPLSRKFRTAKGFKDIGTELVGKQGVVVESIEPGQYGIVKVGEIRGARRPPSRSAGMRRFGCWREAVQLSK